MNYSFLDFLGLLGAVGLFLYGMKVMSEGLQKAAGDRLRNILSAMTRNRFTGTLTGFAITALIQSSSASTVMVVSFVNAGLMSLSQSMAVIMGANVGTTFTAWVIALFGFKVNISAFVLPMIGLSIPLLFTKKSRNKSIGEFLIGFAFLFMGLDLISQYVCIPAAICVDGLSVRADISGRGHRADDGHTVVGRHFCHNADHVFKGLDRFQSVVCACARQQYRHYDHPNTGLDERQCRRKAYGDGFNLLGTVWVLALYFPFVHFNAWLTETLGQGDPTALQGFVNHIEATDPEVYNHLFDGSLPDSHPVVAQVGKMQMSVSIGLSIFHTVFNLINLSVMIWMTNLYVKIVMRLVPTKHKEDEEFQLKFISGGLLNAAELNIAQAEKEIAVFAERVQRMIGMAQTLVHTKEGTEEFNNSFSRLEKYEDISDRMEIEIAHYLNRCSEGRLSNEGKLKIAAMLRIVSEIESIADCCLGAGKILIRKHQSHINFNGEIYSNLDTMFGYVESAMSNMVSLLSDMDNAREQEIITGYNREREINNFRNQLRTSNIENINERHYEYQAGIYYMDLVANLEKTGDYIINVVDAVREQMRSKAV